LLGFVDVARAQELAVESFDVPMLPGKPYDYTTVWLPAHFGPSGLDQADNTPADNSLTNAGATLGRVLFYDKQLSRNNTVACASCHHQQAGFADPRQFSIGFAGGQTRRNAMGLANLRYTNLKATRPGFFWDERAATLEAQALMPIQDAIEMGMELNELETKLQNLSYYPPLFEAAFGSEEITSDRIAKALTQFLRSMVALDSRFDRAAAKGAPANYSVAFHDFTPQENLGKSLFIDGVAGVAELGCAHCHLPPTFGMPKSFNNGLELKYKDPGLGALGRPPNDPFTPSNDGKFKAPSLRNIELTAPYMHDGRFKTLEQVVEHYSSGVQPHENVGLAFRDQDSGKATFGFQFTAEQKAALVAFMKTLTDAKFVSDPKFSDPFVRASTRAGDRPDSPTERYQRLLDEYEAGAEPRELAERFFELAEQSPQAPVAVDALVWVLTKLRNRPEATRALERLDKDHVQSEKLAAACPQIARTPSLAAEKLLRAALEKSPHHEVRAQACLHLASLLDQQAAVLQQLKKEPESADRILQYYGKEYGKHLAALDPKQLEKNREQVYERMLQSFADVKSRDTTMGQVAEKSLFQIRHLSIGRAAPEIEGEDIFGERFRLSDYRGNVVVLSFWGHW
jgi:cytochrome c peroxidase